MKLLFRYLRFVVAVVLASGAASVLQLEAQTSFVSGSDGHLGPLNVSGEVTIDLPPDGVCHYTTITVNGGGRLRFNRNELNTPVWLLATGDVVVDGTIDVSGQAAAGPAPGQGGPGGFDGGEGGYGGTGFGGTGRAASGQGPGGGAPNSFGLYSYGNALLTPLIGGSGGGGIDGSPGGGGGGGGGAILIASTTRIRLGGGDPNIMANGAGAGSGGAIRLVAPLVTGPGSMTARGGFFGDFSRKGGPGRLRIDCLNLFAARSVRGGGGLVEASSSVGSQMFVFPPMTNRLDIIEAAGRSIPEGTTNRVSIILGAETSSSNWVVIQARGFTNDVPIRLAVTPSDRAATFYDVVLAMTNNPAVIAVPVELAADSTNRIHVWTR